MIPTLESERLILRGWRKDDFPAFAAFYADEKRTRHIGGPKNEWQAWTGFASMSGEWALNGYGLFAVDRKEDGATVGFAGLWHPPYYIDGPELAWSLYAGFEGKGYAVEAARRAQFWAHEKSLPPLMSFVHPENLPSQAVAKRLGATPLPPTTLRGEPRLRFRHVLPV